VSGVADLSFDEHQYLALEMLAVQTGDAAGVKEAMRKIIDSAPQGTDVALILSLAMSRAGDRMGADQPAEPGSRRWAGTWLPARFWPAHSNDERVLSRGWVAAPVPLIAALCWWLGDLGLGNQLDGTDTAGWAGTSALEISLGSLGIAVIAVEILLLLRWRASSPAAHPG
jgi:hypothetical protein